MATINTCEPFLFGMNYAWNAFGNDFGGGGAGIANNKALLDSQMQNMANNNVSFVRVWIYADFRATNNGGITFDPANPTCVQSVGGSTQADIEAFTQCAFDNGLKIMWCWFSFNANDTNATQGVNRPTIRDSIVDATCRQAMMDNMVTPVTNFIVNAPNYADTFHSYDLFNEPEFVVDGPNPVDPAQGFTDYKVADMGVGNSVTYNQMYTFLDDVATTIRGVDTNSCITVGAAGKKWVTAWENIVDFNSPHSYAWDEAYFPGSNPPTTYGFTKPTMIGEYPPDGMPADPAFVGQVAGALPKSHYDLLCQWAENDYFGAMFWSYTDTNTPGVNTDLAGNLAEASTFMENDVYRGVEIEVSPATYNCEDGNTSIILRPVSNKDQPVILNQASLNTDIGGITNLQYVPELCYYTATLITPACPSEDSINLTAQDENGNALVGRVLSADIDPGCVTGTSSCTMTYGMPTDCVTGSSSCTMTYGNNCNVPTDCQVIVDVSCNCKINVSKILGNDPNCPQYNEIFEWAISGCDCPGKCGPPLINIKAGGNNSPMCWLEDINVFRIGPVIDTSSIKFSVSCSPADPCINLIENGPCLRHTAFITSSTSAEIITLDQISTNPILIDQILWVADPSIATAALSTDSRSLIVIGQMTGTTRAQVRMRDINNNYYDCCVNLVVNL
jgi:hypothetical protein